MKCFYIKTKTSIDSPEIMERKKQKTGHKKHNTKNITQKALHKKYYTKSITQKALHKKHYTISVTLKAGHKKNYTKVNLSLIVGV